MNRCPYLDNLDMEYLASEYGLQTSFVNVQLNTHEQIVQVALSKALSIVDRHLSYWGRTNAQKTLNRLLETKQCLVGLLVAVRSQENRLAYTCAAIYNSNLKALVQSFRKPITKKNDPEGNKLRQEVVADRGDVKRLLKEVVSALATMCIGVSNDATFRKFVSVDKDEIIKWCQGITIKIEEIPVEDDLTDEEYQINESNNSMMYT